MNPQAKFTAPTNTWGGGPEMQTLVACPICGDTYQHISGAGVVFEGEYESGWGGRGGLHVVLWAGECGHKWELCFGFHKGETFQFVRPHVPSVSWYLPGGAP